MHYIRDLDGQEQRTVTDEQFERIVEAIATGKYSWACLLILRFAGYNPLHYIPYRTYNRLLKTHQTDGRSSNISKIQNCQKSSPTFRDLAGLEPTNRQSKQIVGGRKFTSIHSA